MILLEQDLKQSVDGEVRFSKGDRALYASDSSNYRHVPRGVVVPRSVEAIAQAVAVCARHGAPVVHRGGGTALAGQTIGTNAVIIDSSKYCRAILSLDPVKRLATVEPGCVLDDLRHAANEYKLTFGPDPSTHNHNTLGGMIGNNSCGVHSVYAKRTVDNVESLDILTYDGIRMTVGRTPVDELKERFARPGREGQIYRDLWKLQEKYGDEIRATFPKNLPRLVSGYRLEFLLPENGFHVARALVGTESTCVSVLHATLNLVDDPVKSLAIIGFESLADAADAVPDVLTFKPLACEALDEMMTANMKTKHYMTADIEKLPSGKAWLEVQFGGATQDEANDNAQKLVDAFKGRPKVVSDIILKDQAEAEELWEIRKAGLPVTTWLPWSEAKRDQWEGWEDSAVPPEKLGEYVRKLRKLMDEHDYSAAMYGHFGDGLIHMRLNTGLYTKEEVHVFRDFMQKAADLVVSLGGTLSGEHGDGQSRSELLPKMYSPRIMEAFAEFKAIWDPANKMNPGNKVAPAKKLDEDLRFGPGFRPGPLKTVFSYRETDSDFRRAALRCVGVGECRSHDVGTMCPSYRATKEEKHSTRGRARMFQEMLQGDPVRDGWKSEEVLESLDLCLSCKACKKECPVNVDMATYKSEFMHHHYEGKRRPLVHFAIGMMPLWARLASLAPGLANFVVSRKLVKKIVGIHPDRRVPPFARHTFRKRWRGKQGIGDLRVILWTDTFNNHFTPEVLDAAAAVLSHINCTVEIPKTDLCCGRPYYDFGMLDLAKRRLEILMEKMDPELRHDHTYIVGVEPSCISIFRDELRNMFPDDPRAANLAKKTLTLSEFLSQHAPHAIPKMDGKFVVHGHCHHKSAIGFGAEEQVLRATGAEVDILDAGCCGMAGSFGYETEKYPVSLTIANDRLLPAVGKMGRDEKLVANGFSCRSQLIDLAHKRPLTLPELLREGFDGQTPS